ncbi:unnamed protein product [Chrysoparadoxa australica]
MASEFKVPESLQDLELPKQDRYCVLNVVDDFRDSTTSKLHDVLEELQERLKKGGSTALAEAENFDVLYALVRDFKYVPSEIKGRIMDVLRGQLRIITPQLGGKGRGSVTGSGAAPLATRNAFKMAVFLTYACSATAESMFSSAKQNEMLQDRPKGRKKAQPKDHGKFNWEMVRGDALQSMSLALSVDMSRLWNMGVPDEAFILLFTRLAEKILELPTTLLTKDAKLSIFELIGVPYSSAASMAIPICASVLQQITTHKHLPSVMAELCLYMARFHKDKRLASDLVREIGRMPMTDSKKNAEAIRNVSQFLTDLTVLMPAVVKANISVLVPHFKSEPYAIRSAVSTCIGSIVTACNEEKRLRSADSSQQPQGEEDGDEGSNIRMQPEERDKLLDILVERVHDVSSYTRSAVLKVWLGLVEAHALPLDRVLTVAKIAADRLLDKTTGVRKYAVQLLTGLLDNNPYMGSLDPGAYEETKAMTSKLQNLFCAL